MTDNSPFGISKFIPKRNSLGNPTETTNKNMTVNQVLSKAHAIKDSINYGKIENNGFTKCNCGCCEKREIFESDFSGKIPQSPVLFEKIPIIKDACKQDMYISGKPDMYTQGPPNQTTPQYYK